MLTLDPLCYALPLIALPEQRDAARHFMAEVDETLALARLSPPTPDAERMSWRPTRQELWSGKDLVFSQADPLAFISGQIGEVAYLGSPVYTTGTNTTPLLIANIKRDGDALDDARLIVPDQKPSALELAMLAGLGNRRATLAAEMRVDDIETALRKVRYSPKDITMIADHDWQALNRLKPDLAAHLKVIDEGHAFPNAPYIASRSRSDAALRAIGKGIAHFMDEPQHLGSRQILQLEGWEQRPIGDYDRILRWQGVITPVA